MKPSPRSGGGAKTTGIGVSDPPQAEDKEGPSRGVSGFEATLILVAQVVAVIPAVAYITVREVYVRFYEAFGLTPEDLGLGFSEILAGSVVGIGVVLWYSIGAWIAILAPAVVLLTGRVPVTRWRSVAIIVALVVSFSICWRARPHAGWQESWLFLAGQSLVALVVLVASTRTARLPAGVRAQLSQVAWEPAPFPAVVAVLVLVATLLAANIQVQQIPRAAAASGREAAAGEPAGDVTLGSPLQDRKVSLGPSAVDVDLSWLEAEPRPPLGSCVLYLGTTDGLNVLYDVEAKSVVRVPISAVSMRTDQRVRCA